MSIKENVVKTVRKFNMLSPGDTVIVAVSGGADSVALLVLMLELKDVLGVKEIYAAHMNHCLRGEESFRDENFVKDFCKKNDVHLEAGQADVLWIAKRCGIGEEEAARNARYDFFEAAGTNLNAKKILLGHNADDNAETIIMNMLRGAGLKGLSGIPPVRGCYIRPLIEVSRSDIEKFCEESNIAFVTDTSNHMNKYTRNRVRNIVMPVLKEHVNVNISQVLLRNAEVIRDEDDFISQAAEAEYNDCKLNIDGDICLDIKKILAMNTAIRRRVIRFYISDVSGLKDISITHINSIVDLIAGDTGRSLRIPGLTAEKEYSRLKIYKTQQGKLPEQTKGFCYKLSLGGGIYISEINKTVTVSEKPPAKENHNEENHIEENPNLICTNPVRYDNLNKVVLRSRLPGDKIILAGKDCKTFTKKLQDYFTDRKIPSVRRDMIPLLAHGKDILCIMEKNGRVSANCKVTESNNPHVWVSLWEGRGLI